LTFENGNENERRRDGKTVGGYSLSRIPIPPEET